MLTTNEVITRLELHGTTVRNRCAELFIRSEFDRLVDLVMREVLAARAVAIHRNELAEREDHMGDRVWMALKIRVNLARACCSRGWAVPGGGGLGVTSSEDVGLT